MHFCADEFLALVFALPFLKVLKDRIHAWWHKRHCPHETPSLP